MTVFDVDALVADCRAARADAEPRRAIRAVLERAARRSRRASRDALRPTEGGLELLHHAPDLTVIHIVWAPRMRLYPHDHRMWAAIGIYARPGGQRLLPPRSRRAAAGSSTRAARRSARATCVVLGDDTIHAVANPADRLTGAIHVYGGDFVNQPRSQWGPGPARNGRTT